MLTPKTSILQVRLEPDLYQRLKAAADGYGMTASALMRYQVIAVCETIERKLRESQHQKKR